MKNSLYQKIDAFLEAMWQKSAERKAHTPGRRAYNYARAMFIRSHREAVESAAYSA